MRIVRMESETVSVELTKFAIRGVFVIKKTNSISRALDFFQFAFIEPDSSLPFRFPVLCHVAIKTRTALDEKTTHEEEIHDEKQIHSIIG